MKADTHGYIPERKTLGSCGYDIRTPVDLHLEPGKWTTVDLRIAFTGKELIINHNTKHAIDDWFMMIVPRSGLGSMYGLRLRNTVGIIDQSYRDNILATVTVDKPLDLKAGDRFLQGIYMQYFIDWNETKPSQERNGGYGSTGVE